MSLHHIVVKILREKEKAKPNVMKMQELIGMSHIFLDKIEQNYYKIQN